MNLYIIIPRNPFFENSATANRWCGLIEGLSGLDGTEITLLIMEGYALKKEKKEMGSSGIYQGIHYEYIGKSLQETLWQRRFNTYIGSPLLKKAVRRKVWNYLCRKSSGIVWTSTNLESMKIAALLKSNRSLLKTFIEMSEFLDIHQNNSGNVLQRKLGDQRQAYFENYALYTYDSMALMTKTLIEHYRKFSGKLPEILHLPMTVDLQRFSDPKPIPEGFKQPYIAFTGVMDNAKDGVNILIESFAKIAAQYPDLNLYLVGSWNYDTPQHLKLIQDLKLEGHAEWIGPVERDRIPGIIQNAELLVLPRPDSKQAQGGFPTKLGEYLATGNPVCATTVGEIPNYLTDNESVFFAESGSVDSFAEALSRALSDKENAKRIGENGKAVAEKYFNKDIQAQTLHNFLKKISNENTE